MYYEADLNFYQCIILRYEVIENNTSEHFCEHPFEEISSFSRSFFVMKKFLRFEDYQSNRQYH